MIKSSRGSALELKPMHIALQSLLRWERDNGLPRLNGSALSDGAAYCMLLCIGRKAHTPGI